MNVLWLLVSPWAGLSQFWDNQRPFQMCLVCWCFYVCMILGKSLLISHWKAFQLDRWFYKILIFNFTLILKFRNFKDFKCYIFLTHCINSSLGINDFLSGLKTLGFKTILSFTRWEILIKSFELFVNSALSFVKLWYISWQRA